MATRSPCPRCGDDHGLAWRTTVAGGTRTLRTADRGARGATCRRCAEERLAELDAADRATIDAAPRTAPTVTS
jgi:hypothetical protein